VFGTVQNRTVNEINDRGESTRRETIGGSARYPDFSTILSRELLTALSVNVLQP